MLDIKLIRENPDIVRNDLKKRGDAEKLKLLEELIEYDREWRKMISDVEKLKAGRNKVTEEIAKLKKEGQQPAKRIAEMKEIKSEIEALEEKAGRYGLHIRDLLSKLPDIIGETMKFSMSAYLVLSKSAEDVKGEIENLVNEANQKFYKTEEAKIKKWRAEKDRIYLDIESVGVRLNEFLVRFKKLAAESLGKKRIGVREIFVEKYSTEFELERKPLKPVKIPFVSESRMEGKNCVLIFKNLDEELLQKNYIDKVMRLVKDKVKNQYYEGKGEFKEYVWESKEKKTFTDADPAVEMEKLGWIRRTSAKGQFVFGREYVALLNTIKELMIKSIYDKFGFYEMIFPKFEPWEVPSKSGHALNIYPNAYFVMTPKDASAGFWEEVMDNFYVTGNVDREGIMKRVDNVGMMSFAQCPPFWRFLEGRTVDENTLPLKVYDWSGPTYRNESGGTHGLDRLEEFHRTETLWFGTKEQAIKIWRELKDAFIKFYDDTLDLEFKVARVAPWWMAHAGLAAEKGSEETGTFDFDAYLPYRGARETEWLEIQNDSSNGDKYPKAFTVKGRKEELWSGCAGSSFERIIAAFLAQKGLDTKNWPSQVRGLFEEKMKKIKPLKFL
ncbi:MAG: serine--tRNA ligase [Nanoarchaeota archaeon]|nr:serine--tRNA ligase [Nanoarchaeota archaeon]